MQEHKRNISSLKTVYEPAGVLPYLNIVLVHGLGRTSTETWSKEGRQPCFWPAWLHETGSLRMARVYTTEYRELNFLQSLLETPQDTIDDFVEGLWGTLANDNVSPEKQIPVVFVAHSTGGIVVKQAYLSDTKSTTRSTSAILFLATPHKASAVGPSLTWGLEKLSLVGETTEDGILSTLQTINQKFQATKGDGLHIASFFEALRTHGKFIVDQRSSCLDLEKEVKMPIDADHENITRRPSRDDPGFVKLSRQLQLILRCQGPFKRRVWGLDPREKADLLYRMLGVDEAMDELQSVYSQYVPGTCEWIESNVQYRGWLNDRSLQPRVLFISGRPGSGKSVLTSHIVQSLRSRSLSCQFFFFQHDDQRKRSAASLFASLALQLANKIEPFRDYLVALAAGSYSLEHGTQDLIWNKLFTDELPRLLPDRDNPIYWIVDGLDICGSGEAFLSGLANPSLSSIPIRVVIASRVTPTLSRVCNQLGASLQVQVLRLDKDTTDAQKAAMRPLVRTKLGALHEHLTDQTVLEGQGNFFEVNRIVRGILRGKSHSLTSPDNFATSQPDTRQYWKEVAADMSAGWTASERAYAKRILTLVAYARYPLTIAQVCEAITRYEPMVSDRYDPVQLCGALLQVDGRSHLILKHRTAHEYLVTAEGRDLCCEPHEAHGTILAMSLKAMVRMSVGGADSQPQLSLPPDSWTSYATTSWEFHLSRGAVYLDGELLSIVDSFLEAPTVVWWIFILASSNQLDLLTDVSAALTVLHARRSAMPSLRHNVDHKLLQWATEMAMVHGKFGMHLSRFPRAIYDVVPAFCPETSPIRTLHASRDEASRLVVKGIPDKAWVETLAKIPVKNPSGIACTSQYVALSSFGSRRVRLVSTTNPCNAKTVHHQESVSRMRFSNSGHMIALASLRTISIWQIDIWVLRWTFAAPPAAPMVDMAFDSGDTALLAYFKDGHVWRYPLEDFAAGSCCLGPALAVGPDGRRHVPKTAAFNQGATMLATAYYDLPLSVWDVSSSGLRGPRPQSNAARQDADRAPDPVDQIDWTPAPCHVLTIRGGSAYAWDPDCQVERQICGGGESTFTHICTIPNRLFTITATESGFLYVWTSEQTRLLDKLECGDDIRHICSDGRKIYVLHSNSCDVWRPACLTSYRPEVDRTLNYFQDPSRLFTTSPITSSNFSDTHGPIELLEVSSISRMYCTAHARGKLSVCNTDGKSLTIYTPPYSATITQMVWSNDGQYFATVDVSRKLSVKRVLPTQPWLVTITEKSLTEEPSQVLFNKTDQSILVVSAQAVLFWFYASHSESLHRISLDRPYYVISHPSEADVFLGFTSHGLDVLKWNDLEHSLNIPFQFLYTSIDADIQERIMSPVATWKVSKVSVSPNGSHILVQATQFGRGGVDLFRIKTTDIDMARRSFISEIPIRFYPPSLRVVVDRPLGFVDDDSGFPMFAFLHTNGWVCTVGNDHKLVERFFLPYDWLDSDSLEKICLGQDGIMFVPKRERVGIILNGFELDCSSRPS